MSRFLVPRPLRAFSARKPLAALAITVALAMTIVISGCASGASTSVQKAPTATPTPRVLYQSDLVNRVNEWSLPPQWRIVRGALVYSGDHGDAINLTVPL
jgi:hypothetical protein